MSLPPPESLLPHGEGLCLIERIVSHSEESTLCEIKSRATAWSQADPLPAWIAIEYFAQAAGLHYALRMAPRMGGGSLAAIKRMDIPAAGWPIGASLEAEVRMLELSGPYAAFSAELRSAAGAIASAEFRMYFGGA